MPIERDDSEEFIFNLYACKSEWWASGVLGIPSFLNDAEHFQALRLLRIFEKCIKMVQPYTHTRRYTISYASTRAPGILNVHQLVSRCIIYACYKILSFSVAIQLRPTATLDGHHIKPINQRTHHIPKTTRGISCNHLRKLRSSQGRSS